MRRQSERELFSDTAIPTGRRIFLIAFALLAAGAAWLLPLVRAQSGDETASLLRAYKWRSIGPASAGGRITDIKALDSDFRYAIVAAASGGVWKTINAGTTWTPIFDHYGASSIGAVAMFQANPQILWVGTGEANNRNSVAGATVSISPPTAARPFRTLVSKTRFKLRA